MSVPRLRPGALGRAAAARSSAAARRSSRVDRSLGNEDEPALLDGVDVLVKSPGVPGERPLVRRRARRGDPGLVGGRARLAAARPGAPIVGVTGTNGKTTTRSCSARCSAPPAGTWRSPGNVGTPLTAVEPADWVVCELSSFQLEDVHEFRCGVAVLLNLEPDHLDRHGSFEPTATRSSASSSARTPRSCRVAWALPGHEFARRRPAAGRAADPRARTTARTPPRRPRPRAPPGSTTTRSPRRCAPSRASRTGSSPSGRCAACATSTTRRRPTWPRRCAALAAYADGRSLILGGSLKGEDFAPLAAAIGRRTSARST